MKASTLLSRYLADLQAWAITINPGCKVILARDPYHALYVLATAPAGFLGVLVFDGETQKGVRQESILKCNFALYIQVSRPLDPNPSAAMLDGVEGGLPPLLDLVAGAADRVTSLTFSDPDIDPTALHTGSEGVSIPTDDGPVPLPAYKLTFSIDYSPEAVTPRAYTEPEAP